MTFPIAESFDLYNGTGANTGLLSKWTNIGGSYSLTTGAFGGQALRVGTGNNYSNLVQRGFTGSALSMLSFGVRVRLSNFGTMSGGWFYLGSGANAQVGLSLTSSGQIIAALFSGASFKTFTTLGTSAAGALSANTWQWLAGEVTISDTVGVFNIYVDDTPALSLSGVDTRNGTSTTCDSIYLGSAASNAPGVTSIDYDDLLVTDSATRPPPRRASQCLPTSDVLQGFSRSTGSANYSLVNETLVDGDSSYVQGGLGALDRYEFGAFGLNPSTIDLVQLIAFATNTDVYGRQLALQVKSGATVDDGANFSLPVGYTRLERQMLVDPNTGSAWAASAIPPQAGPKVTV